MTPDEAFNILRVCHKDELNDYAFGDSEVRWTTHVDGIEVACAYYGRSGNDVHMYDGTKLNGYDALTARDKFATCHHERNDSQ